MGQGREGKAVQKTGSATENSGAGMSYVLQKKINIYSPLIQTPAVIDNACNHACGKIRAVLPCLYRLHISPLTHPSAAQNGFPSSSFPPSSSPCPNPSTLFTFPTLLRTAFPGCAPITMPVPIPSPATATCAWLAFSASLLGGQSPSFFHPTTRELTMCLRFIGTVGASPWMMILL